MHRKFWDKPHATIEDKGNPRKLYTILKCVKIQSEDIQRINDDMSLNSLFPNLCFEF